MNKKHTQKLSNNLKSLESNILYLVTFYATKRQIKAMSIVTMIPKASGSKVARAVHFTLLVSLYIV